jgi:TolB-like protein/tetratricopeptide (TPR) repeat protein
LKIYTELSRRNVFRVGIAYAVASWVLLQIVDVISPIFELPAWAPKLIFVILAIGLVPALIFAWAFEMTPEGLKKESEVDRTTSMVGTTGRKLNFVITGFLVLAVALLLVERQLKPVVVAEPEPAPEVVVQEVPAIKSIAVLPFVNMSSDAEQEFFSDGITEEILNSLASVKELKVAGRTSSFAFKGQNQDLRHIGDALGVNHILEGSVRKAGAQVRITAQLIQVDNGFHLWSETYDRELTDVFAIQDEIANEILKQLRSKLLTEDVVVAEAKRTTPEVYELYLQAKQRIYTRIRDEIETAVDELDEAIQLDGEYAPVFAQRGIATLLLSDQQYGSIPNDESARRAKRYIDQSLRLNPNLAEGLAGLGLYHSNGPQNTDASIDALVKALAINPNLIDASNWLQISLREAGDLLSAMEIIEDVIERDPLYRPAFSNAMQMFNNFGQQDKAEALLERIKAIDPDNPDLLLARATNLVYAGRYGEGLKVMEERRDLGNMSGVARVFLSLGLMSTGQFERATIEGSPYFQPFALYETGKVDEAFELAHDQARGGDPENLFALLVRADREQELVDYLEERWPSLSTFAAENPGGDIGWDIMRNVAMAYSRNGNTARFDEAMQFVDRHLIGHAEQGISNTIFSWNRGLHAAMLEDIDTAFAYLETAVDGGFRLIGDPAEVEPALAALVDDPRFAAVKTRMLANVNADRELLGLALFDESYALQQ